MQVCGRKVLQVKGIASAKAPEADCAESGNSKKLIRPQQRGVGGAREEASETSEVAWWGKD